MLSWGYGHESDLFSEPKEALQHFWLLFSISWLLYRWYTQKSLSISYIFYDRVAGLAQTRTEKPKKENRHIYDDKTIENMVRYYKVEENFDILLRYIKSRGLQEDVL